MMRDVEFEREHMLNSNMGGASRSSKSMRESKINNNENNTSGMND